MEPFSSTERSAFDAGAHQKPPKARILILGGGFAGVYAALEFERALRRRSIVAEVTLVARDNFFLFTPMLPEIAASELEMNSIVNPLRKLLKRVNVFVGEILKIDPAKRSVALRHGEDQHPHELEFDHLILALGGGSNFFGLRGVEEHAFTFKTLDDAVRLRNHLIRLIEEAGSECSLDDKEALLTFVVAGGGFAGVETIGAINDFVREALPFYPHLRPDSVRMVLVAPDEPILPELGPKLGRYAQRKLAMRGVEIINHARVQAMCSGCLELTNGSSIATRTLLWTAGTGAHPLVAKLPLPNQNGRIKVDETLRAVGSDAIWAVGDCAAITDPNTKGFYPPTAQHAIREGRAAARNVIATLRDRRCRAFSFSAFGKLAVIGRRTGVANVLGINFSGFFAWWLWRTVQLIKLPRFEKKARVAFDWTLDLFFAKDFACVNAAANGEAGAQLNLVPAQMDAALKNSVSSDEKTAVTFN